MRLLKWTLFVVMAAGLALAVAVVFRVALGNWLLQRAAEFRSLPLTAELTALEADRIVLRNLRYAAPGQPVFATEEIEVRFLPRALQQGRIERIVLRAPVIELRAPEAEPGVGEAGTPSSTDEPSPDMAVWPPPVLVRQLTVERGRLVVFQGEERFESDFAGQAELSGDAPWSAALEASFDGALGNGALSTSAQIDRGLAQDFALSLQTTLTPAANTLLPPELRLGEAGELALSLSLDSEAAVSLQPRSVPELIADLPFSGWLTLQFRDLSVADWAEEAAGEAQFDIRRDGQAVTLGQTSRLDVAARPAPNLPPPYSEALAMLALPGDRRALSVTGRDENQPLARATLADTALEIDLLAAARIGNGESEALALSVGGQVRLDREAGTLTGAEVPLLQGRCRCRVPETGAVVLLSAATALRYGEDGVSLPGPLAAGLESADGEDLATLLGQAPLQGLLGPKISLRLLPRQTDTALFAATQDVGGLDLAWQADARLWSAGALRGLQFSSGGSARVPGDAAPPTLARSDIALATSPLAWAGQEIAGLRLSGILEGQPDDLAARLRLALAAPRLRHDDVILREATVEGEFAARMAGRDLSMNLTAPLRLDVAGGEGLPVALSTPLTFTLSEGAARFGMTEDRPWDGALAGTLAGLRLEAQGNQVRLGDTEVSFSAAGRGEAMPAGQGRVIVSGLSLSDPAVSAGQTTLRLESDGETLRVVLAPTLVSQRVADAAPQQITLSGNARLTGQRIRGSARAALVEGVAAKIGYSHDLSTERGQANIEVPEIAFLPGGLQPGALSPLLAEIEDASGGLSATAQLSWQGSALSGAAEATARQLSFKRGEVFVEELESALTLESLFPLASAGTQSFTAARAGSGELALEAIEGGLTLASEGPDDTPTMRLERAEGRIAGGLLRLAGQVIQPGALVEAGRVEAEDIDLALLLASLNVDGLSGTGRLSGRLPLRLEGDTVIVEGGELSANAPGRIAYQSETTRQALATAGDHMQLTLDALEDFNFTDLVLQLDKPATGDSELAITLQGSNPAVLENYPFRFNIRLIGDPAPFIAAVKQGTRLSDEILRRAWRLSRQ